MPLSPEEQADYDALLARSRPEVLAADRPAEIRGTGSRFLQGLQNIPGHLLAIPSETIGGVERLFGAETDTMDQAESNKLATPGFREMDAPRGAGELTADIVTRAAPELAAALIPAAGLTRAGKAIGMAPKLASIVGSGGAGLLSGARQSGKEAALQAGEFGLGQAAAELIPGGTIPKTLMRMAAQAAVPLAGQVARGESPISQQGLTQGAVQAGMQAVADYFHFRTPRPLIKPRAETPAPKTEAPIAATPESVRPQPTDEEALFHEVFQPETPNAEQISQAETVHGDVRPLGQAELPAKEGIEGIQPSGQAEVHAQAQVGPRIVSTGIQTPEGLATGEGWNTRHADIIQKSETVKMALAEGMTPEQLDANKGFIVEENGVRRFVGRKEALEIARKSGQVDEALIYDPNHGLISEALIEAKQAPKELLKRTPKEALQTSMAEAKERLTAARAMGDADEIGAIESEIKVIGRAMRQAEEGKPKIPLKKPETRVMLPLAAPIRAAAGAGIGYMFGDTEEERMRNAILGGGGALLGPVAAKSLLPAAKRIGAIAEQAARREVRAEPGVPRSLLGRAVRGLETRFNLGRAPETVLALEKGKGALSQLGHEVEDVLRRNEPDFRAGMDDPASRAIGEEFIASRGGTSDIAKLDASPVPQGFKDALKAQKAAQIEAQMKLRAAESDPEKRALYASTLGSYQTRLYRIDSDPRMWSMDDAQLQKFVDQFQNGPLKGMDRDVITMNLKQGLAERRNGTDPFLNAGGNKIKQTLFAQRMDLTPDQWGFIDQMSKDPRTPAGAEKVLARFFADKSINPAEQQLLRALAGNKKLSDAERATFRELADKEILTQEHRDLLGEIKDPFERQLYTLNKLFGSVAQAQTISEISDMVLPSGLKMAMDGKEWSTKLSDPAFKNTAEGYVQLPDSPGFGKLAGKYVPRDVMDALSELQSDMPKWFRVVAKANNWVKEAATAWNPTVHIRQALQSPMFLMAARVGPWDVGNYLKGLSTALKGGDEALMRELRTQHITEANYGHQELRQWADKLALGKQKNIIRKARDVVSGIYGIPDDFVRITAYLKHKPRYWKEAVENGLMGDAAEKYARDKTTIFVNDHTMNYGQVSKGIKTLRNLPGVSPFASYSAELLRITKNLAKDVAQGSAGEKIWGAAGLATLYALPVAISQWARSKFLTPEQQETWDKTEKLMPVSDRSNLKVPFGVNNKGSFKFLNLNPLMPAGDVVSTVRNAAKGDWESFAMQQPFFGFQKSPLVSAGIDTLITGEHGFTHEKLDEPSEKLSRVSEAILPSWVPPSGFMFKRMMKSLTPGENGLGQIDPRTGSEYSPKTLLQSMVGAGERTANPEMLQRSAFYKQKEKLDTAESELKKVLRSGAPESQKEKAKKKFLLKRAEISEAMQGLRE